MTSSHGTSVHLVSAVHNEADAVDPRPSALDVRRQRNRESMRRARVQRSEMQSQILRLEARLAALLATATAQHAPSAAFAHQLQQMEQLRAQKLQLERTLQRFEVFRGKLSADTTQELARLARQEDAVRANRSSTEQSSEQEAPARPAWMSAVAAQQVLEVAADMFLKNIQRTDAAVARRDKRVVADDTWATFLLTKDFPHQSAESLAERTWKVTVNMDELRGMLKWPAGMKVRHRLGENAYVVCRELHLPNSVGDDPICYRYQLVIFRAETPNGFIISTQNLNLSEEATASEMLGQQLLRSAGVPLVTMYGFQFERQFCEKTGREIGCRVKLAGRTSDGSLSYAHKVLTEALPSILRWEDTCVGPILCIPSST